MKKHLNLMLLFTTIAGAQNTLITYSYETNFSKEDKEIEYIGEYFKSIERGAKLLDLELVFNDSISVFRSLNAMNIAENEDLEKAKVGCACREENFQYKNHNYKSNSISFFPENKYLVKSPIDNEWTLLNESMRINNLLCYKAVRSVDKTLSDGKKTTVETIAWYCPELKGGFGPAGFGNLPGVILVLQTGNNIYKAKEIILNSKKTIEFKRKGIEISKEEYLQKINTMMLED